MFNARSIFITGAVVTALSFGAAGCSGSLSSPPTGAPAGNAQSVQSTADQVFIKTIVDNKVAGASYAALPANALIKLAHAVGAAYKNGLTTVQIGTTLQDQKDYPVTEGEVYTFIGAAVAAYYPEYLPELAK